MKKIFLFISILISLFASAQGGWLKPNNSHGTIQNGISTDSANSGPTGCGGPTSIAGVNKYSKPIKKYNLYFDTCAHRFWIYDSKTDNNRQLVNSPFVKETVQIWVSTHEEACELVLEYIDN